MIFKLRSKQRQSKWLYTIAWEHLCAVVGCHTTGGCAWFVTYMVPFGETYSGAGESPMGSPQAYKFMDVPWTGASTSGHAYDWELAQVHLVAHNWEIMDIHSHLNEILSLLRTNPQEDEHVVPVRIPQAVPVSTATSPCKYPEGYSLPQWWHPTG